MRLLLHFYLWKSGKKLYSCQKEIEKKKGVKPCSSERKRPGKFCKLREPLSGSDAFPGIHRTHREDLGLSLFETVENGLISNKSYFDKEREIPCDICFIYSPSVLPVTALLDCISPK